MKGDFSRNTFDKKKHFTSVRMQQGRVQLDADWNEQMDIIDNRIRVGNEDFIGGSGAPSGNPGYKITPTTTKIDLTISKGRFYIQGVLIEKNKDEVFTKQTDFPNAVLPTAAGLYLAYLDVWQQGVSAAIDPSIEEPALNGADTTMRIKNIAQIKLLALPNSADFIGTDLKCEDVIGGTKDVLKNNANNKSTWQTAIATSTGKLSATVSPNANLRNQLYRIEIHNGGDQNTATFKWSRDNGALIGKVKSINESTDNKTILTIANNGSTTLNFQAGQWVELSTNKRTLKNQFGKFVRLLKVLGNELTLMQSLTNTEKSEFLSKDVITTVRQWNIDEKLIQTKSFFPIKSIRENNTVKITLTANNKPVNLAKNLFVELKEDENATKSLFSQIKSINGNTLIVNDFAKTDAEVKKLTLMRVITPAINSVNSNSSISIENGLSITFSAGSYKTGDYWLIPTRAETNNIASAQYDFKTPQLPEGIQHYYAQLALIRKTGTTWELAGDCRNIISALGNKAYQSEPGNNEGSVFVDKTGDVTVKNKLQVTGNTELKKGVRITGETKTDPLTLNGQPSLAAIFGKSNSNYGIVAKSENGVGILAESSKNYAIQGMSSSSYGVYGYSVSSYAVYAESQTSMGVYAKTSSADWPAIRAENTINTGIYTESGKGHAIHAVGKASNKAAIQVENSAGTCVSAKSNAAPGPAVWVENTNSTGIYTQSGKGHAIHAYVSGDNSRATIHVDNASRGGYSLFLMSEDLTSTEQTTLCASYGVAIIRSGSGTTSSPYTYKIGYCKKDKSYHTIANSETSFTTAIAEVSTDFKSELKQPYTGIELVNLKKIITPFIIKLKESHTYGGSCISAKNESNSIATIQGENLGGGKAFHAAQGAFGPFTGSHEALIDDKTLATIKPGMLLSATGKAEIRDLESGKKDLSSTLPTVKLSNKTNDAKVVGVFTTVDTPVADYWYKLKANEKLISFNALGDGLAWVTSVNGDINAGDYITTSNIAGYGMKQRDDVLHSYTLGKAIQDIYWKNINETIQFNGKFYKICLISLLYMSG